MHGAALVLGGRVVRRIAGHGTALESLRLDVHLAAREGLRCSAADWRDALVGGRLRGGELGRGGGQLLVKFEADLLAIEQFLNDLVRLLLAACLKQSVGFENLAASVLVVGICQYHPQMTRYARGRRGVRNSRLPDLLRSIGPRRDDLSDVALGRVELATELVLSVRVTALVVIVACAIAYPILAHLSLEVRVINSVSEATHKFWRERLKAKIRLVVGTYVISGAQLFGSMGEVTRGAFRANLASERRALLTPVDVR